MHAILAFVQLGGPPPDRFYHIDRYDFSIRLEPPPSAHVRTHPHPPRAHPWAASRRTRCRPTRCPHMRPCTSTRQAGIGEPGTKGTGGASGDIPKNEDGILLIPESEASACGRVGVCRNNGATAVASLMLVVLRAGVNSMKS